MEVCGRTSEKQKFIDEIGRCELCGSRRNLQLHHMIPLVCEKKGEKNDEKQSKMRTLQ